MKDMLDLGAMSVLYGESNAGKSFIALLLAFHIASGTEFAGRKVEQGLVVYIVAEGGRRFDRRLAALRAKHPDAKSIPLAIVKSSVDLHGGDADVKEIARVVAEAEAKTGRKALLVIVDTAARAMGAGSENEARDMNALVKNGRQGARTDRRTPHVYSPFWQGPGEGGSRPFIASRCDRHRNRSCRRWRRPALHDRHQTARHGNRRRFQLPACRYAARKRTRMATRASPLSPRSSTRPRRRPRGQKQPTGPKLSPCEAEAFDIIKRLARENDGRIAMAAIRDAMNEGRRADAGDGEFAEVKGNYLRKLRASLIAAGLIKEGEPGQVLLAVNDDEARGLASSTMNRATP